MILTFTKTVTQIWDWGLDDSAVLGARFKTMADNGYSLIDAECPERGEYVGNCETCGLPIFSDDEYQSDDDGIYWHTACCDATDWACEHAVNGCTPEDCQMCEYREADNDQ